MVLDCKATRVRIVTLTALVVEWREQVAPPVQRRSRSIPFRFRKYYLKRGLSASEPCVLNLNEINRFRLFRSGDQFETD